MKRFLRSMLLVIVLLYAGLFAYALFFSDGVIFQPHPTSNKDGPEVVKLASTDGNKISAVHLTNPAAKFTLLVSHGNAEDLGDDRYWLEDLRKAAFNVLAYDYQGYGTSEGKPSEKNAYQDEEAAYDYLVANLKIPPDRIIIFGKSVGSGPPCCQEARGRADFAEPFSFRFSRFDAYTDLAVR